jgi:hypothetical protein
LALDRHFLEVGGNLRKNEGLVTLAVGTTIIEVDGAKYQKARPAPSRTGRPFRYWMTYCVGSVLMKRNPNMPGSLSVHMASEALRMGIKYHLV